jgi:ParB family chromosome partitioning protein
MGGLDVKAAIESIIIKERIRKDISKIPELAEDIRLNGLINPVTVMALDGDKFQLLAGLRRIKAVQSIGATEIEVNVVLPADAEAVLRIEYSENEQRVDFTFSEKMDYTNLIKDIEAAKAKERMSLGGKGNFNKGSDDSRYLQKGKSSDSIGAKINMSGRQYERAKYVSEKASPEVIDQIDKGERSISGTYDELKTKERMTALLPADDSESVPAAPLSPPAKSKREPSASKRASEVSEEEQMKYLSAHDREVVRKQKEFAALPPEGKIAELERQLFDMRVRANAAESDLETLKYEYGIKVDHKDSIIDSLKRQVTDLTKALETANKKLAELEKRNPAA